MISHVLLFQCQSNTTEPLCVGQIGSSLDLPFKYVVGGGFQGGDPLTYQPIKHKSKADLYIYMPPQICSKPALVWMYVDTRCYEESG